MTSLSHTDISSKKRAATLIWGLLLVLSLLAAAYFRLRGIDWGEFQYLHPDERFLVWVGADISPVDSISAYFDTAASSLNPHNRGHGFYVYGTLPMFVTRYVVEWVFGHSGFDEMTRAGRPLAALVDLGTVLLVFLTARRLYDRRVGVLAAAFLAATALHIQQSHFFTMETYLTFFAFLAFYCAVLVVKSGEASANVSLEPEALNNSGEIVGANSRALKSDPRKTNKLAVILRDPLFLPSLGFGIALGMAVASKLNAGAVAVALPVAMLLYALNQPAGRRESTAIRAVIYLFMAAFVSLLVFRIFQPYAFSGPGFFGVKPNPLWVDNIRDQRAQSTGEVDFPPAMQWARRPLWFSLQNMTLWGLGLPLGILAWTGFLWAGWRLLTRWNKRTSEWTSHALLWSWTALYFAWQSLQLNPTMRYQMPIYPNLAIFAAWTVFALIDLSKAQISRPRGRPDWARIAGIAAGALVLLLTFAYAFAFSSIYERPITRIEASRWIYANLSGPINLRIEGENGLQNQILPVPYEFRILPQLPYSTNFSPSASGALTQIVLPQVSDESVEPQERDLTLTLNSIPPESDPLATATVRFDPKQNEPQSLVVDLNPAIPLDRQKSYNLTIALPPSAPMTLFEESAYLGIETFAGSGVGTLQPVSLGLTDLSARAPVVISFQSPFNGVATRLLLQPQPGSENSVSPTPLGVSLLSNDQDEGLFSPVSLEYKSDLGMYQINILEPLPMAAGEKYRLHLSVEPRGGVIALAGTSLANEGDWDDGLPLRIDGYDGYGGIYPRGLDFNMYWDDNPEKLERFVRILNASDYITISSNRQWGTLPRIPERFPMTTVYYRALLGCPPEQDLVDCYRVAAPGMFAGQLGFDLIKTFTSDPALGPLRLNDQFAEEAFTVYDHPKVLIFKKNDAYSEENVRQLLGSVDFDRIIRKPPLKYSSHPEDLMLPEPRLQEQQQGGTWSVLFNPNSLLNRSQPLAGLAWYLSVALLGLVVFPILRLALPGLDDRGYPLARTAGMLLLSFLVWLAGSFRIAFDRTTISLALGLLALIGGLMAYWQREELLAWLRSHSRYILVVEGLTLLFFLAFLLVRLFNPDLWHIAKGGEKPMDFSYFNAVLKSASFPPYDPWYSGGYLNYYYYGFVVVGTLVKWLGITPAVAYNLILPTLFSLIAMGAFSLAWNLAQKANASRIDPEKALQDRLSPYVPAISAALGMAVLGNLGTVKMISQGLQKLGAPRGLIDEASIFTRLGWAATGIKELFQGMTLQYGTGDWYWNPSRIIPAMGDVEPITEFPYFTLLYADLHAHLIALPIALLALGFMFGITLGNARWRHWLGGALWFLLAALSIGALRPTNTWDLPLYLALGVIAVVYSVWKNTPFRANPQAPSWWGDLPFRLRRLIASLGAGALLAALALLLFQPYVNWYALGYTKINLWKGPHTPFSAYMNHWGLFLIVLIPWMIWETRDWLAKTPLSALHKLQPYRSAILFLILTHFTLTVGLLFGLHVSVAWFVLPLAAWAGVLIFRPNQPEAKRIVLFLIGSGLALTLMVEVIVLVGDIGRMNTVFKFYLQVWTILAVSAGAALAWLIPAVDDWLPGWRWTWQIAFVLLVGSASLYTMQATLAKIDDRMVEHGPVTLDGMAYMPLATYTDEWGEMDLGQDYKAIRWLQENVQGSPVIVEANLRNLYRWGSRYTIYTGLPGVVGWEWHQQQQRTAIPGVWITERIFDIDNFYLTEDLQLAADFLRKYNVQYIIVGQQERGHYPGSGLKKFELAEGILWREVYRDGDTVIYRVIEANS